MRPTSHAGSDRNPELVAMPSLRDQPQVLPREAIGIDIDKIKSGEIDSTKKQGGVAVN